MESGRHVDTGHELPDEDGIVPCPCRLDHTYHVRQLRKRLDAMLKLLEPDDITPVAAFQIRAVLADPESYV